MAVKASDDRSLVVLIEDDAHQLVLLKAAIREAGWWVRTEEYGDGPSALQRLIDWVKLPAGDVDRPVMVLLDLRLPGLSGIELLRSLKSHQGVLPFPVIMLTSSKLPGDIVDAFIGGVFSYHIKPSSFGEWVALMDTLGRRWLINSTPVQE
ncbi:MAG: response regulator [Xanthomonadales bacterium]|nr:response regulator [Xanthomonadales bacterium]